MNHILEYDICIRYSVKTVILNVHLLPLFWSFIPLFLSHKINFVTLMFSSISLSKKKKFYVLCFLCVLDPDDHFTKSRPADKTLTWKISISNSFLTIWPIHFILGMMVKQLDWHLMIYFSITLTKGQRSNYKVKQAIRCS